MNKHRLHILFAIFLVASISTFAQTRELPSWVAMIDNPNTNFYEARKAFNDYWVGKIKPIEEMDVKDMEALSASEKEERKNYFASMTNEEKNYFDRLQYHHKRFKQWIKDVKPFVQEDGRILTMEERIAIWDKQQLEMKQQKNK